MLDEAGFPVDDFPSFSEGLSLRHYKCKEEQRHQVGFPFLFGRAFIEARARSNRSNPRSTDFPSFSEGLSLRQGNTGPHRGTNMDFPSFSEGLSLRPVSRVSLRDSPPHFPSFSEGLSLRLPEAHGYGYVAPYFPSFSEGLSLRCADRQLVARNVQYFFAF